MEHPDEKFVIFAQPVETVYTLKRRLERILGAGNVALIVGEQSPEARKERSRRFWKSREYARLSLPGPVVRGSTFRFHGDWFISMCRGIPWKWNSALAVFTVMVG